MKHIIQFVASVGAVFVLYVLSYPPVVLLLVRHFEMDEASAINISVYRTLVFLFESFPTFQSFYDPYFLWWVLGN
jgi:hypothetical protein